MCLFIFYFFVDPTQVNFKWFLFHAWLNSVIFLHEWTINASFCQERNGTNTMSSYGQREITPITFFYRIVQKFASKWLLRFNIAACHQMLRQYINHFVLLFVCQQFHVTPVFKCSVIYKLHIWYEDTQWYVFKFWGSFDM